jgi:hypothetical protein
MYISILQQELSLIDIARENFELYIIYPLNYYINDYLPKC